MRRILKKSSRVKQQRVNETIPSNTCKRIWWLASRSRLILLWMLSVICLFQGSVEHIDRSSSDAWIHPQCQWSRPNSSSREISEKANEASLSFLLRNWSMRWKRNWLKWFIVEMVLVSRSIVYGMVPTRWVMKTMLKSLLWMSFVYSGSKTADQEFEIIRGEDCQRRARLSDIVDDLRCGRRYKTCFKNRPTSTTIDTNTIHASRLSRNWCRISMRSSTIHKGRKCWCTSSLLETPNIYNTISFNWWKPATVWIRGTTDGSIKLSIFFTLDL